jgi:hypothetical protein
LYKEGKKRVIESEKPEEVEVKVETKKVGHKRTKNLFRLSINIDKITFQ